MANIINDPYAYGAGGAAGQQVGSAIGGTLQRLADRKIQHIEDRYNRAQQLRQMFENQQIKQAQQQQEHQRYAQALTKSGVNPQSADVIAWQMLLHPSSTQDMIGAFHPEGLGGGEQAQQYSGQAMPAALTQPTSGQPTSGQPATGISQADTASSSLNKLMAPMASPITQRQATSGQATRVRPTREQLRSSIKPYNPMDAIVAQKLREAPMPTTAPATQGSRGMSPTQQVGPQQVGAKPKGAGEYELPPEIIAQIAPSPEDGVKPVKGFGLTAAQRATANRQELKEARAQQHYIDKAVKPFTDELDKKGGRGVRIAEQTLDRMEKLIDTGKLTGPTMYNLRTKLEHSGTAVGTGIGSALGALAGGVLGSVVPGVGTLGGSVAGGSVGGGIGAAAGTVLTPKFVGSTEDQEFTKLSRFFMNNMKDIFGARVTQQEVAIFMDSIPTLAMSDSGKKAVINNMRLINEAWKHKKEVKDKIIKVNGGYAPANIETLVEQASTPYLDSLAKKFAEGTELSIRT